MKTDIWFKRIWLTLGILVLAGGIVGGVGLVINYFSTGVHSGGPLVGPAATPQGADSLVRQNLTFDQPWPVGRTDLLSIAVRVRDLTAATPARTLRIMKYSEYSGAYMQSIVNVLFTKADGSVSYALLDRKAYIKSADIPSLNDTLQSFHLYDIAFLDTDHDGRITGEDSSELYMSDLAGHNLIQMTSHGDVVQWYQKSRDCRQVFINVKQQNAAGATSPADWPERLYVFDTKTHKLSPFPADAATIEGIREQLWGK
jgi:hypothetical protein